MFSAVITCDHVSFRYEKGAPVLSDLSFELKKGQVLGLLGPNGAGKTTLIKLIIGLYQPSEGTVRTFGQNPFRTHGIRNRVGVMHQTPAFEQMLSGWDNLRIYGRFFGLSHKEIRHRVSELTEMMEPMPYLDMPVLMLSGGQVRRLQIVRALLNQPRLLLLDEPTVALDVEGRHRFYRALRSIIRHTRATVIWTSHYLDEIERNCDSVMILREGRVALNSSVRELEGITDIEDIYVKFADADGAISAQHAFGALTLIDPHVLQYRGTSATFYKEVLPSLLRRNLELASIEHRKPNLEDIYLHITQTPLEEPA